MSMSPRTKKILMLAVAAVGGYVAYTKMIKPGATAAPSLPPVDFALAKALARKPVAGVEESLGSLGGSLFR
jgi:hypothetical protein